MTKASSGPTNRLASETSPYLLGHAHNPVDWYAWGPEALERAVREDRPILLSIGYAACHWCHVMERESFENQEIARFMNQNFVCIKVDREERPDLDDIYMAATVALTGQGGWPMTSFLHPDQRPFFAGTYFPPFAQGGRPGFLELMERIAELWRTDRPTLDRQGQELTLAIRRQSNAARPAVVTAEAIPRAVRQLGQAFDSQWGGFSRAPKFPPSTALQLLLRHSARTQDQAVLGWVTTTLDAMRNGGIHDHLAGGFARYSTDEQWLVPHFEKMLYDNAQLARVYLEAFQFTGNSSYEQVARRTLDYVLRELQSPEGGFFSATDADSEGEEGKFFVWEPQEVEALLGHPAAEHFCKYYDVAITGNWEGKSILHTPRPLPEVARELGMSEAALGRSLEHSRSVLYAARQKRVKPLSDDKIIVSWNALMLGTLAEAFRVLREPRYLAGAERAADYLLRELVRPDGGLYRTARGGKAHLDGYLEDYAFLGDALVDLYEAGGNPDTLSRALALAERLVLDFGDPDGGAFFSTASSHEPLLVRTRDGHDGALPNATAVAARLLARLAAHLDREDFRDQAVRILWAYGKDIERMPRSYTNLLGTADFLLDQPVALVVSGEPEDSRREALLARLGRQFLPNRVIAYAHRAAHESELALPLVEGRVGNGGATPQLFICKDYTCQAPISDLAALDAALTAATQEQSQSRRFDIASAHLAGHATEEGTRRYADRHREAFPHGFVALGGTGLTVTRLGFGGYRIEDGIRSHEEALAHALRSGVNLIDTSTNYTNGGSERLIGTVLHQLSRSGELSREEVLVVSKIGYVQGANLERAQDRQQEKRPFPDMVEYAEGVWHSIHPEWLEDQLSQSLARLGLSTLDVCLLHNPEYFLSDVVRKGRRVDQEVEFEFYRRVELAFRHLESEVARGRIRYYGVSSNTVAKVGAAPDATVLAEFLAAAQRAGGASHHFRVLELPFNLVESEALLGSDLEAPAAPQNAEGENVEAEESLLYAAAREGVAILVNRPLNAIVGDSLVRLAEPEPSENGAGTITVEAAVVADLEAEFQNGFAQRLRTPKGEPVPRDLLNWGQRLVHLTAQVRSLEQWNEIETQVLRPQLAQVLKALDGAFRAEIAEDWQAWKLRYVTALDTLLKSIRHQAVERSRTRLAVLRATLDPSLPDLRRNEPLSRLAVWALISSPGVTTVLTGMRQTRWVDDLLPVLGWTSHADPDRLFRLVKGVRF